MTETVPVHAAADRLPDDPDVPLWEDVVKAMNGRVADQPRPQDHGKPGR